MQQESAAERFRRKVRRKLYQIASCKEFVLHDSLEDNHWMQQKLTRLLTRLESAVNNQENTIILVTGRPGSGKTYLVTKVVSELSKLHPGNDAISQETVYNDANVTWTLKSATIETYNHRDEHKCLRQLMYDVEILSGVTGSRGHLNTQEIQERVLHCLKLLKQDHTYVIIVIEGLDILTKGVNDCSEATGSVERRQSLLYFLGNLVASQEVALAIVCITPDIRTTERLEKRVRSRFMQETVYCDGLDDINALKTGHLDIMGPGVDIELNEESKALLGEEVLCGNNISRLVAVACAQLPDDAIEELSPDKIKILPLPFEIALRNAKGANWVDNMINQLAFPEHCILVAMTRMHCQGIKPITLIDIESDLKDMARYFPREHLSIPEFKVGLHMLSKCCPGPEASFHESHKVRATGMG
uniref:Orc1-like AAA ATPase domain-containing protein n=1 Tax=Babesia bovis TaxID=5865 RepID=A7ANH3_BABBO|eukprot:XP_001611675.1 hypothetical protein [Babesia bovis T2Bo]